MKYKLIILFFISSLIIYLTYNHYYQRRINIISINSLYDEENYNGYLSDYLSKSNIKYNFNIDYTNNDLEIENLITKIETNENNLQSIIHKSDIIILSIGNIDYKTEELKTIIEELKKLFQDIRKINTKEIIYVSPYKFKNVTLIKEVCKKYNVTFISGASFKYKPNLLSQIIIKNIESKWNKEKY